MIRQANYRGTVSVHSAPFIESTKPSPVYKKNNTVPSTAGSRKMSHFS